MIMHKDCQLRKMAKTDLDLVLKWRNSESVRQHMFSNHTISMAEHCAWFSRAESEERHMPYIFVYQSTPIGFMGIADIDRQNNRCKWGFYLSGDDLPKGCGSALGYFCLQEIFEENNFRKLSGEVFAFNQGSIKFHQRLGFREEGRLIRHILNNGKYQDIIIFALFVEDWQKNKSNLYAKIFAEEAIVCAE